MQTRDVIFQASKRAGFQLGSRWMAAMQSNMAENDCWISLTQKKNSFEKD